VGLLAAGATLGLGQLLIGTVRPLWARLAIAIAFVAPAAIAGYHATLGIVKHTMPSETWQIAFSIIGAIAVGATAFARVTGMAAAPTGQDLARA
jgi:disulfide bond formation protein DsbB